MAVNVVAQWQELTSVREDFTENLISPKRPVFFVLGSGSGPGSPNKKTSIFSLGEITRLMKFPGVTRTFIVKIAAGLPSGETVTNHVHSVRCAWDDL